MQKNFFEILVQTALTVGLFWTILKLTPNSFTLLYPKDIMFSRTQKMSYLAARQVNKRANFLVHQSIIPLAKVASLG